MRIFSSFSNFPVSLILKILNLHFNIYETPFLNPPRAFLVAKVSSRVGHDTESEVK